MDETLFCGPFSLAVSSRASFECLRLSDFAPFGFCVFRILLVSPPGPLRGQLIYGSGRVATSAYHPYRLKHMDFIQRLLSRDGVVPISLPQGSHRGRHSKHSSAHVDSMQGPVPR